MPALFDRDEEGREIILAWLGPEFCRGLIRKGVVMRKHLRLIGMGIAATAVGVLASFALAQPGLSRRYGLRASMPSWR